MKKKLKMLIVDDSKTWFTFNKNLVNSLYPDVFDITIASSAAEAFKIITNNINSPFDIVLSDLQMELDYEPQLAGEWLVCKIKSLPEYENVQIILISAMSNIDNIAADLDVSFISKPKLINNKLYLKYYIEKLLPALINVY